MNSTPRLILAAALPAAVFMSGCLRRTVVVQPPPATVIQTPAPAYAPSTTPPVVVLKEAPPPPRFEEMTPRPSSEYTWIPGYWAWHEGREQWIAGHWEVPPHVGATWVSSRWERQGDGYVFIQGYWQ
jgi:hypothetical protein